MTKKELYDRLGALKIEMTPAERMAEYRKGKEVDCIPYGFLAADGAMASIWGYSRGDLRRSFEAKCDLIQRKKEAYGFTGLSVPMGLRGIGAAAGSKLAYPEYRTDYVEQYVAEDYRNLDFSEPLDLRKAKNALEKIEEGKRLMEAFPEMQIGTDVAGPITTAVSMRPVELVLRDMRKDPEHLHKLLDYAVDASLAWVKLFMEETGCQKVGISDPVTSMDVLGYRYFTEFSKPYFAKLFSGIMEITGKKPSVHICGHTKKIWQDLAELGVVNFSLDNCEDLAEAKACVGDRMFLSGNVAPVDVMLNGTIDDVMDAVQVCIQKGADSPAGYMLMTGCQVPIGTPKENLDAYVLAAHIYGKEAQIGKKCKAAEA